MPSDSFEDIISGQFSPDEWYEYGFNTRFSLLKSDSGLGQMALRLECELDDAREEYDRYREDLIDDEDPGWIVYEEELSEGLNILNIAREKRYLFHAIYQKVWQVFDPRFELAEARAESEETGKSLYEVAINLVVRKQLHEISRDRDVYSREEMPVLISFVREVGLLYTLEEGVHNIESAITSATSV